MEKNELDARLRAAQAATEAARTTRERHRRLRAARRSLGMAQPSLRASAPAMATEVADLLARLDIDVQVAALPAGDPWALTREVAALRSEGVEAHRIARSAIRVGVCPGPPTAQRVAACEARLRKDRERWTRTSRP